MKTAIYPGTFDPVTNGHLDVLKRARRLFDRMIVAVADNTTKKTLFTVDERVRFVEENISNDEGVSVLPFSGLVVDFARERGAVALVRGLRALGDFEHEFEMAQMNRYLDSEIETVFLMTNEKYFFTSSTLVKEVCRYAVRGIPFVPDNVREALKVKFGNHA